MSSSRYCLGDVSDAASVQETLRIVNHDFFAALQGDTNTLFAFMDSWSNFINQIQSSKRNFSEATLSMMSTLAGTVQAVTSSILELETTSEAISADLSSEVTNILTGIKDLCLDDDHSCDKSDKSDEPTILPHIDAAYEWFLLNLHNPYPSKEIRSQIASLTQSSLKDVDAWFINARKRIGWNACCKTYFKSKKDMVQSATSFYRDERYRFSNASEEGAQSTTIQDLALIFITLETRAKALYSGKVSASLLNHSSSICERTFGSGRRHRKIGSCDFRPLKRKRHSLNTSSPPSPDNTPEPSSCRKSSQKPDDSTHTSQHSKYSERGPSSALSTSLRGLVETPAPEPVSPSFSSTSKRKRRSSLSDTRDVSHKRLRTVSEPLPHSHENITQEPWSIDFPMDDLGFTCEFVPPVRAVSLDDCADLEVNYKQLFEVFDSSFRSETPELYESISSPLSVSSVDEAELPSGEDIESYKLVESHFQQTPDVADFEPFFFDTNVNQLEYFQLSPDSYPTLLQPLSHSSLTFGEPSTSVAGILTSSSETGNNANALWIEPFDKGGSFFYHSTTHLPTNPLSDLASKRLRAKHLRDELRRLESDIHS